jgi:putative ABC transport system permease protein
VACANVANLLLARATARSREISIRAALGAGGSRLVRQLLTESVLLSLVGGVLGCVGAHWGVAALKALGPEGIPRLADIHVEGHVLAFALSLSVLTGLLFGLAPAFYSTRIHLHDALRQGGRTTGSDHRSLRSLLVVAEVALTLVLAVGAGLLIRTFVRVVEVDPGFRPDRLLTLNVFLTGQRYDTIVKQKAFVRSALERLEALPGVETASMVSAVPFGQTSNSLSFQIEGREAPQDKLPRADYRAVDPEYFRNMSIPLVRGRPLTDHDDENAPRVVLVNEAMVRRFWAGDDPIGQTIRWVFQGRDTGAHTVVGVVADVKSYGLDREERPAVYGPFAQRSFPWLRWKTFAVRTASPSSISAVELRQALLEIDPDLPVYGIVGMEELMADSLSSRRFIVLVLSSFAAVALVLASVGIYGVISYGMTRRTNEIGVRMALGARRHDILGMVIREGMAMTSLGIVVGVIGAVLLTRYLQSLLFGVEPTDPLTFLAVVVLFVAVAAGACFFPANRSMKIDPVRTLRHE